MKSLSERFSIRKIKLIFTIAVLISFGFSLHNALNILLLNVTSNDECAWRPIAGRKGVYLITDVVPGGVTDKAGIKNGDILVKLNGKELITEGPEQNAMMIINAVSKGDLCTYLVERDGKLFETNVEVRKVINIAYIANFVFGFGFLIVGYVVVMSRPTGRIQRLFGWFSTLAMLAFGLSNMQLPADSNIVLRTLYIIVSFIVRGVGPFVFIYFFLNFPVKKNFRKLKTLFAVTAVISLTVSLFLALRYNDGNNDTPTLQNLLVLLLNNIPMFFLIAGLCLFTHSYFRLVDKKRRKALAPILIFSAIGISAYVYTMYVNFVSPFSLYINPVVLLPALFLLLVPVGFGYSIFRYKLMDTEVLIKKSLMYAIVTAMIAAIYIVLVFGTGNILGEMLGHKQNQTLSLIALVIIAFVFDPIKRRIQDWVDKVFYVERQNYQKVLLEFSRKLPLQVDLKQILNSVVTTISGTMHIEKAAVILFDENKGNMFIGKNISESVLDLTSKTFFYDYVAGINEPLLIANLADEWHDNAGEARMIRIITKEAGVELVIPIKLQDKLLGVINTGNKLSEKIFTNEDLNLLMTVANQTAVAIENSRLYEKEKALSQMQEELRLAQKIQLDWMPKCCPVISNFDISGMTLPAKIVGGDYYDYISLDDSRLALCIGDVSGKGLPAAMLMANLHAIVRSQTLANPSPSVCVRQTNRLIYESSNDEMFITLFYALLDIFTRTLTFTNGGHNLPLLIGSDGNVKRLDTEGLVIGVDRNSVYGESHVTLSPGDTLVMYTDGISEAFNSRDEQFGEPRIIDSVKKACGKSADETVNILIKDVGAFTAGENQFDDMTIVVLKAI